jgi:hypothetical protein
MSDRYITIILPTHNAQTARVLLAIVASEGKSDDVSKMSDSVSETADALVAGFATRQRAVGYSDIIQTDNLHLTVTPDRVKYVRGRYVPQTIRIQISAYSCDPYGREAIGRIVEQVATRY